MFWWWCSNRNVKKKKSERSSRSNNRRTKNRCERWRGRGSAKGRAAGGTELWVPSQVGWRWDLVRKPTWHSHLYDPGRLKHWPPTPQMSCLEHSFTSGQPIESVGVLSTQDLKGTFSSREETHRYTWTSRASTSCSPGDRGSRSLHSGWRSVLGRGHMGPFHTRRCLGRRTTKRGNSCETVITDTYIHVYIHRYVWCLYVYIHTRNDELKQKKVD